jgi:hypothetical protein
MATARDEGYRADATRHADSSRGARHELPQGSFQCLEDAGMWVSRETGRP